VWLNLSWISFVMMRGDIFGVGPGKKNRPKGILSVGPKTDQTKI
tara:strand:- start:332 stop:463 length:132 start_codon:yes stop_codon:yes gene_type:complete